MDKTEETEEIVKAEYFATIIKGKVAGVCHSNPPHELLDNQIMISKQQFELLQKIGSFEEAEALIKTLRMAINANEPLRTHNYGAQP